MPITSAAGLVEAVRRFNLLPPLQAEELVGLQPRFADARALARELLQRGWLTPYQINQLVAGNGVGLVLGQYVLLERIGEGGMGQVLKARHQRLERIVALKLIRKERLVGHDAVQRFQREARAAARLSHPNLVTVYDADEVGGTHFYAMEYVEGADLAKLVRKQGMLPIREACEHIRQAALGLQHAHEQGLVHRDIKPANLMLTTKGVVKVLDLGLARLAVTVESGDATDPMTQEGAVMGTPDYMAPEQATDPHGADVRADLYSLGCTLFQLLTGKVPYPGGTLTEKLLKHQTEPLPRVEALRSEVPPDLAAVVRRLMAKKRGDRYQTPAELAAALEPFCGNRPPVAIPVGETVAYTPEEQSHQQTETEALTVGRPKPVAVPVATVALPATPAWWKKGLHGGRRLAAAAWPPLARIARRRPWLAAGAGGLVALLFLVMIVRLARHWHNDGGQSSPNGGNSTSADGKKGNPVHFEAFTETLTDDVLLLGDAWGRHWGGVRCAAYGPAGSGLAASGGNDNVVRLWDAKTLEPRGILKGHDAPVVALAFSPDGKTLASSAGGKDQSIWLWGLDKQEYTKLEGHENVVSQLVFSRDGKWLLSYGQEQVVRQWNLATGESRRLPLGNGVRCVALCPDGQHALSGHADKTLRLWDVERSEDVCHFEGHAEEINQVAFSPDGKRAVSTSNGDKSIRLWDVKNSKELHRWQSDTSFDGWVSILPDGRRVCVAGGGGFRLLDEKKQVTRWQVPSFAVGCALSPDGTRGVCYGYATTILMLIDVETGMEVPPHKGHANSVLSVAFTRDGEYLLSGGSDGYVIPWSWKTKKLMESYWRGSGIRSVAVSPDHRYVAFGGQSDYNHDGNALRFWDIKQRKLVKSFATPLEGGSASVVFSHDGRLALSGGYGGGGLRLYDVDKLVESRAFEGANEDIYGVAFSPDGKRAVSGGALRTVRLWDVATGKELRFLSGHGSVVKSVAFLPDGRHILSGSADTTVRLWDLLEDQPKGRILEDGPSEAITCVTVAPDGKTFAASGQDGQIAVWTADTGERLWHTQLPGAVNGIAYAGDSRHLATANDDGTIFILRLPE